MTLLNFENDHIRDDIPHRASYDRWMQNLDPADFDNIVAAIHEKMDNTHPGQHVITSSWIPGSDWTGTPYDPIYKACNQDREAARLFFGQIVWRAVQLHPEDWYYIRQQTDGDRIIGLTYFRPQS